MMLLIRRRRHDKHYRNRKLLLVDHVAFLLVVVVVVFFFVTPVVDATSATTTDAAATTVPVADDLIVVDSLVDSHEEKVVLKGTSAIPAGKLLTNTNNHTVHLASQQQRQPKQSQKQQKNLTPTKFLGLDYKDNPVYIPLIGTGTWQYDVNTTYESVCKAFGAGYNFVDTAYGYKNQKGVGMAIKDCWKGNRTDLFVMTKIPGKSFIQ